MVDNSQREFPDLAKPIPDDVGFRGGGQFLNEGLSQARSAMRSKHGEDGIEIQLMKSGVIQAKLAGLWPLFLKVFVLFPRRRL